jgi:hypothetical protein
MSNSILAYLNLLLLAVACIVYVAYEGEGSDAYSRAHHVYIYAATNGPKNAAAVRSAVEAIETDWNCRVTVIQASDDPPAMARALKKALTLRPAGVSMPGSADERYLLPIITEAQRQGVPVTYHTSPAPEAQRHYAGFGAGFVGMDAETSGQMLAEAAMTRLSIAPGNSVLLVGQGPTIVPGTRLHGCRALLQLKGIETEHLTASPSGIVDTATVHPELERRIADGTLPRIVFWEPERVGQLTDLISEERLNADSVRIVTLTPVQETLPLLQARYIAMQPIDRTFLTCYVSLVQLELTRRHGLRGMDIPIGGI